MSDNEKFWITALGVVSLSGGIGLVFHSPGAGLITLGVLCIAAVGEAMLWPKDGA